MISRILSPELVRVLGSMIEKQFTTPLNYPMTINAIKVACNQKSNRDPMVEYDDDEVFRALQELQSLGFAEIDTTEYSRSTKYAQTLGKALGLERAQVVLLAELFNRGPQTLGELRLHCERMHRFLDSTDMDHHLQALMEKKLIILLEKAPGTKEPRWAHLFCGKPRIQAHGGFATVQRTDETRVPDTGGAGASFTKTSPEEASGLAARVTHLESLVVELQTRIAKLEAR